MLLREMAKRAEEYISAQKWCNCVDTVYLAYGVGGVVAIFLVELTPRYPDVDPVLWVIIGDLPSAYLVIDDSPTAADALEGYLEEMTRWTEAVKAGESTADLIPVNVPPTSEWAGELSGRLEFLRNKILPRVRAREKKRISKS